MSGKWFASIFKWYLLLVFVPITLFGIWKFLSTPTDASLPIRIAIYVFMLFSCSGAFALVRVAWIDAKMRRAEGEVKFALYDELMEWRKKYFILWLCCAGAMGLFVAVALFVGNSH